jgi:alpha-ketoglutarate-dependent taurine dioxygenase
MTDWGISYLNNQKLPALVQAKNIKNAHYNCLVDLLTNNNTDFKNLLVQAGAILFRGFGVNSPKKFLEVINACNLGLNSEYKVCPIPRKQIAAGVHVFAEPFPRDIPLHNEKSYEHDFPDHVYFNCLKTANTGGYTPLADGHKIWLSLPESLQYKLKTKGILYRRFYYGNSFPYKMLRFLDKNLLCKTWMSLFQTQDKHEVEHILTTMGHEFQWAKKGNELITEIKLPAVRNHPITHKSVWFNQSNLSNHFLYYRNMMIKSYIKNPLARTILSGTRILPYIALYGDEERISEHETRIINDAIARHTVSTPWQVGDVMIVDNYACLHGKTAHTGERLILVGLTNQRLLN